MKHPKLLVFVITITMLSGLIFAVAYNNLTSNISGANSQEQVPPSPKLQILYPEDNGTYQRNVLPLNITANNATAKITYSLDGGENITVNDNSTTMRVLYGAHNIIVYGFDNESKVGDAKNVTFNVINPYLPTLKLTLVQVQQTVDYFEARGLKVQILDTSKPQNCLYYTAIDVKSKEDLANCAIAKGVNVIYEMLDLNTNYVGFCANYYDHSPLPTVYNYAATLIK